MLIKNLLIVLVVLLVLLTLISTFGGSIRTNEKFTDVANDAQGTSAGAEPSFLPLMPTQAALVQPPQEKACNANVPDASCAQGDIGGFDEAAVAFETVAEPSMPSGASVPVPVAATTTITVDPAASVEPFDGCHFAPTTSQ